MPIFVGRILCGGTPANPLLGQRWSALPAASEPQRFWFTDVASRSVFPYRTNNDFRGRKYFPPADVRRRCGLRR
jgi:hypothetical protein